MTDTTLAEQVRVLTENRRALVQNIEAELAQTGAEITKSLGEAFARFKARTGGRISSVDVVIRGTLADADHTVTPDVRLTSNFKP